MQLYYARGATWDSLRARWVRMESSLRGAQRRSSPENVGALRSSRLRPRVPKPGGRNDDGGSRPQNMRAIKVRSGLAVFERRLFVCGHALFGHREQHGDADIGSGNPGQIDDLLFAEKLLGAIEQFVGDSMFGREVSDEIIDDLSLRAHAGGPLVGFQVGNDRIGESRLLG